MSLEDPTTQEEWLAEFLEREERGEREKISRAATRTRQEARKARRRMKQ